MTKGQARILLSAAGKEFFGEQESLDVLLDDAESAAGLGRKPVDQMVADMYHTMMTSGAGNVYDYDPSVVPLPMQHPPAPRLQWRSYAFEYEMKQKRAKRAGDPFTLDAPEDDEEEVVPMVAGATFCVRKTVDVPFRPWWLIVATPGFKILELRSSVYILVNETDGDLYLSSEWDNLAVLGKLDRLRLPAHTCGPRGYLQIDVTPHAGTNVTRFSAMVVGQEAAERY